MRLRVVLLGLTGLGNKVFLGLGDATVAAVFTETYEGPYPYYPEVQLSEVCREHGVPSHENVKMRSPEGAALLAEYAPDLLVVATFKQIIPPNVLTIPRLGAINFHPSLLPFYRGPSPTKAALLAGEMQTGVTVCHMIDEVDAGRMILQRALAIAPHDDDGALRQKIAGLAGEMAPQVLALFRDDKIPTGTEQDHTQATWAARPDDSLCLLETSQNAEEMLRRFRALNPYPGVTIDVEGHRRRVLGIYEPPVQGLKHATELHGRVLELAASS